MADDSSGQRRAPGVYIPELNAFPSTVVGVPTAVPAFIGYTETAQIDGESVAGRPMKITTLADYEAIFGNGFRPPFEIEEASAHSIDIGDFDFKVMAHLKDQAGNDVGELKYYTLVKSTSVSYNLYDSLRLFYDNGGGDAYVVSVGGYGDGGVKRSDLEKGLRAIAGQVGPTMLVIPEAVLLPPSDGKTPMTSSDFHELSVAMIRQCGELRDRVAILDVYAGGLATKENLDSIVADFRRGVGSEHLGYGMAYFPFLATSVVDRDDFSYGNIVNLTPKEPDDGTPDLQTILKWEAANLYGGGDMQSRTPRYLAVSDDIDKMAATPPSSSEGEALCQNLNAALPLYGDILDRMANKLHVLPPSGAMAGIFTAVDHNRGVWNAPANVSLTSVIGPTLKLTDAQQGELNVPVDGKAVNALREFVGRGTVVWGARTLDGNSNDYRYIQVRRTLIYIEQSIKQALQSFTFAANDGNTWTSVTSMVSTFLQGLWSQGGLMGATAAEAYTVRCGLGSTMTGQDILEGYMIVEVTLQMIHPGEFIELTFKQKMEGVD